MFKYKIGDRVIYKCSMYEEYQCVVIGTRKDGGYYDYILLPNDLAITKLVFVIDSNHLKLSGSLTNYNGISEKYLGKRVFACSESLIAGLAVKQKCTICVKQNDKRI